MVESKHQEVEDDSPMFENIGKGLKKLKKPKGIEWFDYGILIQLVVILFWSFTHHIPYENVVVYASAASFFSYWLIRIVFNPKLNRISLEEKKK